MKILFVTFFIIILDQITKLLVKGIKIESLGINIPGMYYGSSKPLIGDYVKITFIENPGMAFGINVGPKIFLTLFTILASVLIFFYIYKHRKDNFLLRLSLSFILAGAIGNLIDRTLYGWYYGYAPLFEGRVVDFIQVEFWDFTFLGKTYTTWPIFNIADISVTIGFLLILFFHKRVFHTEEPVAVIEGQETLERADGDIIINQSQTLNSKSDTSALENSKEYSDTDSTRTEKNPDR